MYPFNRCGKTTICQVFAGLANQKLYSVNCHLHMETSDFLGGLRPVRQKPKDKVCSVVNDVVFIHLRIALGFVHESAVERIHGEVLIPGLMYIFRFSLVCKGL